MGALAGMGLGRYTGGLSKSIKENKAINEHLSNNIDSLRNRAKNLRKQRNQAYDEANQLEDDLVKVREENKKLNDNYVDLLTDSDRIKSVKERRRLLKEIRDRDYRGQRLWTQAEGQSRQNAVYKKQVDLQNSLVDDYKREVDRLEKELDVFYPKLDPNSTLA